MKKTVYLSAFALLLMTLLFAACKPDEPVDPNEEELITKVQLTFTDSATGAAVSQVIYSDPDGDGGNAAVRFDSIRVDSGKTYNVSIALYDESDAGNIVNVTDEVLAEAQDHLFCYTPSAADVSIMKTDSDGTFPIGVTTRWSVGNPGSGTVRVELRHQPDGTKDGTCTPGSTDVQLDFQIVVN
ncbi:MAG: hypothetical protein RLZZ519_783 [Bacteroidota bacterium]|jgi:hypothetical protein